MREDEDLGHGDGVEPALHPCPDGGEEGGGADDLYGFVEVSGHEDSRYMWRRGYGMNGRARAHEYPVQRLRVVRRGQLAGGLHVALEVPELLEADAADVDDVGREGDRGAGVLAVRQLGAQRLGEARQVLVEGEEADQLGRRVHRGRRRGGLGVGLVDRLLVGGDGLGVEVADLEEVERDAAVGEKVRISMTESHIVCFGGIMSNSRGYQPSIPPPRPLWVKLPALLVGLDIDSIVQHVQLDSLPPFLGVLELAVGVGYGPFACAQEAQQRWVVVRGWRAMLV